MSPDHKTVLREIGAGMKTLQDHAPDVTNAFGGLHKAAVKDGAMTSKHKELIALGIAVHTQCEACIVSHIHSTHRAGGTREEMAEAVGVAIMMGGGPALMYAYKALDVIKGLE